MKVLVVDDQRLSRAGIIKMVQWEQLGLELAGECANGREALEMMGELEIDVVITDVRMPVLGGLELIERAKEFYPHMAFVIISGFDDYVYVRKSIHLSVTDYLLKPVDQLELNALLSTLIEKTQGDRHKAAVQLQKTREQFFYMLLEGAYGHDEQMRADWEDIRLSDQEDHFIAAMFDSDLDKHRLHEQFQHLTPRCSLFLLRMRNGYTCIAVGSAEDLGEVFTDIRTILTNRELFQLAGIGAIVKGIVRLNESVLQAYDAYTLQVSLPTTLDLNASTPLEWNQGSTPSNPLNAAWEREWFILLKQGNRKAIMNKLEELHNYDTGPLTHSDLAESVYPYVQLRGAREMYEVGMITEPTFIEAFQIAKKLPYIVGVEEKRRVVANFFIRCLDTEPEFRTHEVKEVVEKAKSFIDANFNQTINLSDLAQTYYMSPGYFSTLFRQHTGRNFLEYLTQLRMEHAKTLIDDNPNGKIGDIASQCGYQDLKHFRKLFKRYTGLTPLKYKEDTKLD
ncbi:putative response regulatory protein [compost metagenome]